MLYNIIFTLVMLAIKTYFHDINYVLWASTYILTISVAAQFNLFYMCHNELVPDELSYASFETGQTISAFLTQLCPLFSRYAYPFPQLI